MIMNMPNWMSIFNNALVTPDRGTTKRGKYTLPKTLALVPKTSLETVKHWLK